MTWPDLWYGDTALAQALRVLLTPASWLYGLAWSSYRATYDLGLKKPRAPFSPILVIGNLTVGGSGKTPVTVFVAQELGDLGVKVVIGASGYGGQKTEGASLAPMGPLDPKVWGDEPALFRLLLPDVDMIVGRGRVQAAALMASLPTASTRSVLLMDDGFQHLPLLKTASIVLDRPSSNHRCLPAGPYREPRSNLRRADLVIGAPDAEFHIEDQPMGFEKLSEFESGKLADLGDRAVDVLCAIGRPEEFVASLKAQGVRVRTVHALPDHSSFVGLDWSALNDPIVVTAKDAVKLSALMECRSREVYVARHQVTIEPRDAFRVRLQEMIS